MEWLLAAVVLGSAVFSLLAVVAARRYRAVPILPLATPEPISVLKPLAGIDDGLEDNLRSFFRQEYTGGFEILMAVRAESDPAADPARRIQAEFPEVPSRLLVVGEPPYANAKVWSLDHMTRAARHQLLAMCDSDIRVDPGFLRTVAAEFQDPRLAVSTCPYRAVPGRGFFWAEMEAIMMNTDFLAGILVARMLEGMRFAVGPTIVARKSAIDRVGGWTELSEFLAEDFVLGQRAAERGMGVGLSSYVVEHRIGGHPFGPNATHRLRWCRSTRRSRPSGYVGQLFTFPVPLALMLLALAPAWWPLALAALATRAWAAWEVAGRILRDPLCRRDWWLVPLADLASFAFWIGGFFGNTIAWRGRTYHLRTDGRFERIA